MALTEDSVIDSIEVLLDGQIQVRRADRVFKDGREISKSYHRHVVSPGDDLQLEDRRVALVARAVHSATVVAEYKSRINKSGIQDKR